MMCPNCGAELPEGSTWCAACGNSIDSQSMGGGVNDALFSGAPAMSTAPAKKSSGPIIAIIVAIVAIAAIAVVAVMLLGGGKNGTYKLTKVSLYGQTLTVEELSVALGGSTVDMTLEVKGNKCEIKANMPELGFDNAGSAKITFKGDEVTVTDSEATLSGTYDKKNKTISLYEPSSGVTFIFEKQ